MTVASNLPEGDAGAEGTTSQASETRERVNYEVSETERQIVEVPGAIKRLTVAVLVNGMVTPDQNGEPVFTPRPEEELAALEQLVASAVGFDPSRGDAITIKSMQFEQSPPAGTLSEEGLMQGLDTMTLVQLAVLAVVALVLGLFVIRPLLSRPAGGAVQRLAAPDQTSEPPAETPGALTGEIDTDAAEPAAMALISGGDGAAVVDETDLRLPGSEVDPAERLRGLIGERREETVEILRSWLEGEEEHA